MSHAVSHRHRFTYPKQPGTSSPRCVDCQELNPRYRPVDDPLKGSRPFWHEFSSVKLYPGGVVYGITSEGRFQQYCRTGITGHPAVTADDLERSWADVYGSDYRVDLTYSGGLTFPERWWMR